MQIDNFETLKPKIAKSLKEFLIKDTVTPPGERHISCDIHIPYAQVKQDDSDTNTATAVVTYVVGLQKEKKHTVRVKFQHEANGKYVKDSLQYI